jgi:4-hydroxy-3-polyprenylbenzoate decarboxylase
MVVVDESKTFDSGRFPVSESALTMDAMTHRCLADFLEELENAGELTRIEDEVDPTLEASEINQTANWGGPALLFGAVKGYDLPILCNLLATESRISLALGGEALDDVANRIARLLENTASESWLERLKAGNQPAVLEAVAPRKVRAAACQQIVRLGSDVHLDDLPMLAAYFANVERKGRYYEDVCPMPPEEPVRAITSAIVNTADPDSHRPVTARFDLQWIDRTHLALGWADDEEHARLLGEYRSRDQKMPLAVIIGGDPAVPLAASAPLPAGTNVYAVAGLLREKALDVVTCRSIDLEVPAESEIILEGFCDPFEPMVPMAPLCGPTGYPTRPRRVPVMQVTAITHRANPVYAVMVPGKPPHEAVTVARAMQRVFRPLAKLSMPDLVDYDLPEFAAARHWAAVSIRKTYPGQAHRAACAAWNLPALKWAKVLVVVDADVDVSDYQRVLAAVTLNMRPDRDILTVQGPADPFDPAATNGGLSQRMAIDATRKLPAE